jgi:hypothetical protein
MTTSNDRKGGSECPSHRSRSSAVPPGQVVALDSPFQVRLDLLQLIGSA